MQDFHGWNFAADTRLSKQFHIFYTLPHGFMQRIYNILSEIDRAPYQIIYHSQQLNLYVAGQF